MSKMPTLERGECWSSEAVAPPPTAAVSFLGIESDAERWDGAAAAADAASVSEYAGDYRRLRATIPRPDLEGKAAGAREQRRWFECPSGEVAALYRLYDYACEVERADEVLSNRYTYPVEDRPGEEKVKMAENVKAFAERGFTLVLQELRAGGVLARRVTSDYLPFSGRTSCGGAAVAGLRREEDERPVHHDAECLSYWIRRYALFLAGVGVSLLVMGMMLGHIMNRMSSSGVRPSAAIKYEAWKGNRSAEWAGTTTAPPSASTVAGVIDERMRVPGGMSEPDEDRTESTTSKEKAMKEAKDIFGSRGGGVR